MRRYYFDSAAKGCNASDEIAQGANALAQFHPVHEHSYQGTPVFYDWSISNILTTLSIYTLCLLLSIGATSFMMSRK